MRVRECLDLVALDSLPRWSRHRVTAALKTLRAEVGDMDVSTFVAPALGQRVSVPGDDAQYVVFGQWDDGTLDLIREQGSFQGDVLVGWRPGQSLEAYRAELAQESVVEVESGAAGPDRRDGPRARGRRG